MQSTYEPNLSVILPLLDEVWAVLESPSLLSGECEQQSRSMTFGQRTVCGWQIVEVSDYLSAIDINVTESPYLDLNRALDEVRSCYHFFDSYAPCDEVNRSMRRVGKAIEVLDRAAGAPRVVRQMKVADDGRHRAEKYFGHVTNTVSQHFEAIACARAVTASRMFPITEILLDAYSAGLYPFGWSDDDDAVLCVRP